MEVNLESMKKMDPKDNIYYRHVYMTPGK